MQFLLYPKIVPEYKHIQKMEFYGKFRLVGSHGTIVIAYIEFRRKAEG